MCEDYLQLNDNQQLSPSQNIRRVLDFTPTASNTGTIPLSHNTAVAKVEDIQQVETIKHEYQSIPLNDLQIYAYQTFMDGKNIFLNGEAGTGKQIDQLNKLSFVFATIPVLYNH